VRFGIRRSSRSSGLLEGRFLFAIWAYAAGEPLPVGLTLRLDHKEAKADRLNENHWNGIGALFSFLMRRQADSYQ
jgi:hypothetical protein